MWISEPISPNPTPAGPCSSWARTPLISTPSNTPNACGTTCRNSRNAATFPNSASCSAANRRPRRRCRTLWIWIWTRWTSSSITRARSRGNGASNAAGCRRMATSIPSSSCSVCCGDSVRGPPCRPSSAGTLAIRSSRSAGLRMPWPLARRRVAGPTPRWTWRRMVPSPTNSQSFPSSGIGRVGPWSLPRCDCSPWWAYRSRIGRSCRPIRRRWILEFSLSSVPAS
mmetsp:Transcript_625/g.1763  ORF Transcript_625/g.1763 Transcript_625/m.1763 type:complete len:226 (-) Transcript_625:928-1605(-)